ncbi:hypothetical protein WDD9_001248 [Paenibacillus melissococcoides]|uniref:hypothetical protein n=1 Tax=Paenibacillus TaxID=44249 RepID=UPI001BD0774C|nr:MULTISPECIES: hypothetical protein [Paenibacillus]CAH8703790.1 hypothetical protein HTL2_000286 [Paenibacillus melissococcoides]CAH8706341.1 hypothetical protein WDD9_001248 [Paenibacillus melissococcoides]
MAAQKVHFDYERKSHSIDNVLNSLEVDVLPSIALVDVWGKLLFSGVSEIGIWITVMNPEDEVMLITEKSLMSNIRDSLMTPGIDFSMSIRFLANMEGNYKIQLCSENKEIFIYPLYISCQKQFGANF